MYFLRKDQFLLFERDRDFDFFRDSIFQRSWQFCKIFASFSKPSTNVIFYFIIISQLRVNYYSAFSSCHLITFNIANVLHSLGTFMIPMKKYFHRM